MSINTPYNPLDKRNLGTSVADALLQREAVPLPPTPFSGAGVYAIYYLGNFKPYRAIAEANQSENFSRPVYVGKAVHAGRRKGGLESTGTNARPLSSRLRQHANSIEEASNLELRDFFCRHLVVEDIFIPLGESLLIDRFAPVWNALISGFGNHDPGAGRRNQARSDWDVLHPGRTWAEHLKVSDTSVEQLVARLQEASAALKS